MGSSELPRSAFPTSSTYILYLLRASPAARPQGQDAQYDRPALSPRSPAVHIRDDVEITLVPDSLWVATPELGQRLEIARARHLL